MSRTAVIDLGSNSFRLVVYEWEPDGPWMLTDEIREPVRISEGMGEERRLRPGPVERAVHAVEVFAAFLRATGIDDVVCVGTSALREAVNAGQVVEELEARAGLSVRILSGEEEARYGALAILNSTTISDGVGLDMGGGSIQLVRLAGRRVDGAVSLPLGAVRATELHLSSQKAKPKQVRALRETVGDAVRGARVLDGAAEGRIAGIGGAIRNIATAVQKRGGLPPAGVQGFVLEREALGELLEELASLPAEERGAVPGIKPDRGDVILAAAVVLDSVLEAGGFGEIEVTEAGLREGIFFERLLGARGEPLLDDVRRRSVENLSRRFPTTPGHVDHVSSLSIALLDELERLGLAAPSPVDRELLHAACELHDIGVAIDYDDHHRHSEYLVRGSALPGFSQRELALIAAACRWHRKGTPDPGVLGPLARPGDGELLDLMAGILRVSEQLERARDGSVRDLRAGLEEGRLVLTVTAGGDPTLPVRSAQRASDLLARRLGVRISIRAAVEGSA